MGLMDRLRGRRPEQEQNDADMAAAAAVVSPSLDLGHAEAAAPSLHAGGSGAQLGKDEGLKGFSMAPEDTTRLYNPYEGELACSTGVRKLEFVSSSAGACLLLLGASGGPAAPACPPRRPAFALCRRSCCPCLTLRLYNRAGGGIGSARHKRRSLPAAQAARVSVQ